MSSRRARKSSFVHYTVGLLALAALITAAFFAPQFIFWIQDSILCRNTELGVRESMGVEALNTAYEQSLAKRMRTFAEGLEEGENYYVAAQELEVGDEINEYVLESVLYSDVLQALVEGGLLPYDFWISTDMVRQWKQYVIYSDNYTKGVNFILWYLEVESAGGVTLKLLTDAEDDTIYAAKLENSENVQPTMDSGYLLRYVVDSHVALELWYYFAGIYEAMGKEEIDKVAEAMKSAAEVERIEMDEANAIFGYSIEGTSGEQVIGYYLEDGDRATFRLPYGEAVLNIIIDTEDGSMGEYYGKHAAENWESDRMERHQNGLPLYPDIVIGVQEIYEMIPEFA